MEQQLQQAVEIALSGTADASLKSQAYAFINDIKLTQQGYQTCVDLLLLDVALSAGLKFFIFQVIEENITNLDPEHLYTLSEKLFQYVDRSVAAQGTDEVYLRNKLADVLGKLFCLVYSGICVDFIRKLLVISSRGDVAAVDIAVRVFILIHYEVADKLIARSKEDQERNIVLKDLIRDRDMAAMVESWKTILVDVNESAVLQNTLKVVGFYIDWMEILLFVQAGFLDVIYNFLTNPSVCSQACLTLVEIISKKMKPANKLQLLRMLDLASIVSSAKDDDLDFMEQLLKLSNQIGTELCLVLENDAGLIADVTAQLECLWPIVLGFVSHEYDDVSQQTYPFIQQYLLLLKKAPSLMLNELLATLLRKVINKMKLEPDGDGFDEDDQFVEIRLKLKTFQDTIAILSPSVYLEIVPQIIELLIFGSSEWNTIELGLYELSNFADSLKNNLINLPKLEVSVSKPYQAVQDLLIKIINNFQLISHPKNQLAFFELIIRHFSTKNFNNTTATTMAELNLKIMELFSDYGMFNGVESVRLRSWYLFFRFVTVSKPKLNAFFLEQLILKMQPLLEIKAELPTRDEDDDLVENGIFSNQLYLFEALGLLVAMADAPTTKSVDILLQPLFGSLETCISRDDKAFNPLIALQAHHLLMAIATIVRGLDTQAPGKSETLKNNPDMVEKIENAAQVVLISLENFNKNENVREAARYAFARFIPVLDARARAHLSKLVLLILALPNLKISELGDFVGFVGQLVHQFKNNDMIFDLLNDLLTPTVLKVYEVLQIEDENYPNLVREKYGLKKSFLSFISILVINNQFSLLLTETNKPQLPRIMSSIVDYACDLGDPMTTKTAVTQFSNVVSVLGCNDGKLADPRDQFASTVAAVEGIDAFLMENTVKMCFQMPFQQPLDLKDAQMRNVALELAVLLKTYQTRLKQQEFVTFLATYLTKMGLAENIAGDFCEKLVEMDAKSFKKYYVSFLGEMKK